MPEPRDGWTGPRIGRLQVDFSGGDTGEGPLTWGQQATWRDLTQTGRSLNIVRVMSLPAGTTTDDCLTLARLLIGRYPALRTRIGSGADGSPRQVVQATGSLAVDLIDGGDDPLATARLLSWYDLQRPFDHTHEWPVRLTLVCAGDVPSHAAWTFSHLSLGPGNMALMLAGLGLTDLGGRLPSAASAAVAASAREAPGHPPAVAMSLLELARREADLVTRPRYAATLRHWETGLRELPLPATPVRTAMPARDHRGERCWHVRSHSPATFLALRAIAARTNTDPGRVMMALHATALARATGVNPVVTRMMVSNRARPGFAGIIGPISQYGLCTIDASAATVDEVVARARTAVLTAIKYAHYDPASVADLADKVKQERGTEFHVGLTVNDRKRHAEDLTDVDITPGTLADAAEKFSVRWEGSLERFPDYLDVSVDDSPGTIDLSVSVDTGYLPMDALESFLRGIQDVALAAALDPATPTGVPAYEAEQSR